MQVKDVPVIKLSTLRKDLYFVMSLLLADGKVAKVKDATAWTRDFHEDEVCRLLLLTAAAMRSLLGLLGKKEDAFGRRHCGEYWSDFKEGIKTVLTFRQACNSAVHAKEILTYKALPQKANRNIKIAYVDRITVRGIHKNKQTRAQIDIIQFVQTANAMINFIQVQEGNYADR